MYEELGSVKEPVALSPREALNSAQALLTEQGYEIVERTPTSVTGVRRKRKGMFGHSLLNLTAMAAPLPQGGVHVTLQGTDNEGVQERQTEWSRWAESLPKLTQEPQEQEQAAQGVVSSETAQTHTEEPASETREGSEVGRVLSGSDRREEAVAGDTRERETQPGPTSSGEERRTPPPKPGGWASVASWDQEPRIAAGKHEAVEPPPPERPSGAGVDQSAADQERRDDRTGGEVFENTGSESTGQKEDTLTESNTEKHTVRVGLENGSVGETVSFTAHLLGTARVNGGAEGGGMDYTFYRLRDGTFRVLVEHEDLAILVPSNMSEAIPRGQRNNYSYGRMTLEEMKAHEYNFGEVYEALMENHPETVRNRVRDID